MFGEFATHSCKIPVHLQNFGCALVRTRTHLARADFDLFHGQPNGIVDAATSTGLGRARLNATLRGKRFDFQHGETGTRGRRGTSAASGRIARTSESPAPPHTRFAPTFLAARR